MPDLRPDGYIVGISPAVMTKLTDRGSFQTMVLVMDVKGFLRDLAAQLGLDECFATLILTS